MRGFVDSYAETKGRSHGHNLLSRWTEGFTNWRHQSVWLRADCVHCRLCSAVRISTLQQSLKQRKLLRQHEHPETICHKNATCKHVYTDRSRPCIACIWLAPVLPSLYTGLCWQGLWLNNIFDMNTHVCPKPDITAQSCARLKSGSYCTSTACFMMHSMLAAFTLYYAVSYCMAFSVLVEGHIREQHASEQTLQWNAWLLNGTALSGQIAASWLSACTGPLKHSAYHCTQNISQLDRLCQGHSDWLNQKCSNILSFIPMTMIQAQAHHLLSTSPSVSAHRVASSCCVSSCDSSLCLYFAVSMHWQMTPRSASPLPPLTEGPETGHIDLSLLE